MLDLEGKELEKDSIYILPGKSSAMTVGRFSHETECSFVFKSVKTTTPLAAMYLYSWKRQIPKWKGNSNINVIKASQELIDRYDIK